MEADWSACLQTLEGHSNMINSVAFSHDGKQVVSGSDDKTVKIWDTSSGACLQMLKGHSSSVNSVTFSHDGKQVASGSRDKTVKIWNASSGLCIKTLATSRTVCNISFDTADLYLLTDIGSISLDIPLEAELAATTLQASQHQGYGPSADQAWITWKGRKVLWLLSEYRSSCSAVAALAISIGCSSGRVLILNFSSAKSPPSL
jgi:WD40 repeat protein